MKIKHVQITIQNIKQAILGANGSLDTVAYYIEDASTCIE
jgi:hypothetical protein